ncbi:UDP-3-O-(3-hydroxymyristoyl)glucosamine N-acyltransferase [Paracrocinitomix mangrovi]|uniref:UDP-3-O-(3-hydroxymyristoyl)glucosamine N-acyltransferase n=1 Tax=Paracrocinitomix mangrovi TaxID=2862509 RepID=UPI001C8D7A1D|nr:UDP-3-O-(3-hydroxymyristoyl)glucosamine N-acyltransferase [Paracrocinitomix mangrovi]UKN01547.1 UDP-3-O-(3-hydroxymyristoyl)glucosamine N-acyltransferase [Paracrocinitomix mangrovi]
MEFSAQQIADILNGQIVGDAATAVSGLSKIEEGKPGTLSFLANPKYEDYIYTTKSSIVIVNADFSPQKELPGGCTLIKVPEAYTAFAKLLEMYDQAMAKTPKIEEMSYVSPSAKIGKDVYIGAFAYVADNAEIGDNVQIYPNSYIGDNVKIGDNTVVYSGVHVYRDCIIGKHCTLHSGAIIGADGFGFAPNSENNYQKVPQIGNTILEDHVSIGANTTVDRATLGSTIVKKGVKLDNLVQIGHNVVIGENTVMAAQVGIAGSTKLGKNIMIGGQVGIVGHIEIADEVKIGAQSGVGKTIRKQGETVLGSPAYESEDYKKAYMGFRRLPFILNKLRELENELNQLKEKNESNG